MTNEKPPEEKPDAVKKWLDPLGNSMFVCCLGPRKVAVSKALLTYLEYDVEEFAVEVLKYRAVTEEYLPSYLDYSHPSTTRMP